MKRASRETETTVKGKWAGRTGGGFSGMTESCVLGALLNQNGIG